MPTLLLYDFVRTEMQNCLSSKLNELALWTLWKSSLEARAFKWKAEIFEDSYVQSIKG